MNERCSGFKTTFLMVHKVSNGIRLMDPSRAMVLAIGVLIRPLMKIWECGMKLRPRRQFM